ncbi:39S ribosomal protein L54, mitochondrial [Teleopsis dalmanni]|uniref:39S ribosomal protein L54, mitochondrial n=1 Tax=Teleopsis dalmanni TaxID=139649 RepID=UPI000D32B5EA|nr:39S ribosomal protein L54, mitochondrial [Teleopsis dalmanni]
MNNLANGLNILKQKLFQSTILTTRFYAKPLGAAPTMKKKKLGKLGPMMEKKEIPVETDVNKLVNYVCGSNIYKTGEDIKLKPDSEYPDWLWSLNVDRIIPLEELDPNTKQYWRRVRKMALRRNNQLAKLRRF